MVIFYIDTSAAMKLLVEEAESTALREFFAAVFRVGSGNVLAASLLLHTELHCAAGRRPSDVNIKDVQTVLDSIDLFDLTKGDLLTAGTLPGRLRSNDSIHLAVALRIGVDEMITYDVELANACAAAGISVVQPS